MVSYVARVDILKVSCIFTQSDPYNRFNVQLLTILVNHFLSFLDFGKWVDL